MYTVYQTTCLVNSKFYIGVHKTDDPNDDYLGSGKVLKRAIEKYGVSSFKKEILHIFDEAREAFLKEQELVTEALIASDLCYNLKLGGQGGWEYNNDGSEEHRERCKIGALKTNQILTPNARRERSRKSANTKWKTNYDKMADINRRVSKQSLELKIGIYSELAIENRKRKFKEINHQSGSKNSNFGTMWITDGISNKKLKNTDNIPEFWYKGRV
jgi:hypothetical protein